MKSKNSKRKLRDDSEGGKTAIARQARADVEEEIRLPFGMTFDPKNPELHEQEFKAICGLRPKGGWNDEELRHILSVCILNRELAATIYNRDWTTANQLLNLASAVNRQLGVLTKARDQSQSRREAESIKHAQELIDKDPDCCD